jgi:hypothetical protein
MSAIAITATFTAEPVGKILDFWLTELDISGTVAFARYNQVFQELLDDSGLLASNRGGINVVLLRLRGSSPPTFLLPKRFSTRQSWQWPNSWTTRDGISRNYGTLENAPDASAKCWHNSADAGARAAANE